MSTRGLPAPEFYRPSLYWEERARRFAGEGDGLAAVCAYGMPGFYNRAIDLTQRMALAPWLRVDPGMRVLDVGCGVGRWSRLLAARGAEVTGVDLSPTMIGEARRRAAAAGLAERCRFLVQDSASLDLGARFDLVLGVTMLQHILDLDALRAAVQRIARHVTAAGRIVLLEAAPTSFTDQCDSTVFKARQRDVYLDLFADCGLKLRGMTGVDPAPFRTFLLPHLPHLPRPLAMAGLALATAMSLPIDALFGRLALAQSWHAVFICRVPVEGTIMRVSRRTSVGIGVLVLLSGVVAVGRWYEKQSPATDQAGGNTVVNVTNGGDRGPGTLREALFIAAAAKGAATVSIQVPQITVQTALPPLVNPHGVSVVARPSGAQIDAHQLASGPVFDIAGPNTSIEGLHISNCPGAAILLRAVRFRLRATTIESCDVGVEAAENASDTLIEDNHFTKNKIAVRFGASGHNTVVDKNEFANDKEAALWAVRSGSDVGGDPINVHDNRFSDEHTGIVAGNVPVLIERNEFFNSQEAAVHLVGAGAVIRGNRISGGAGMGVVVENARSAIVDNNEIDGIAAYGVMVRGSANALVRGNRIHNTGYGLAFVLGDPKSPSTAVENTIIETKFNGIDVIGDSPVLRKNQVLRPHALALHLDGFTPPGGQKIEAKPFLDNNTFDKGGWTPAAAVPAAAAAAAPGAANPHSAQ